MALTPSLPDGDSLLKGIINRERESFGELYLLVFSDLYYFAAKLYNNTEVDAGDAVHDVFLALWQSSNTNFQTLDDVRAYLFISVQNNYRKYLRHNKYKNRFSDYSKHESKKFQADLFETGILSLFHQVLEMLPDETAEIFRLFFMGWSVEEIAKKMGKEKQTIYNIRSQALATLRNKLADNLFYILLILLSKSN